MPSELLSPAGNLEKMRTAFAYGADAVYMGLKKFSLRSNADNFTERDLEAVRSLKERTGRKMYCAMNILFHENQMQEAIEQLPRIADWPFDAFIISDLGLVDPLQRYFGNAVELHLSTQASCLNAASASQYRSMGFSRIIMGREASLDDIKRIKDKVPELQIETFVHGAMCMAYSGRCLLSSHLAGRSGNQGDCAHTCRWNYRLVSEENRPSANSLALEEQQRPGVYYPITEQDGYTTILSSKDLCMIDHLEELKEAGVDAIKIEGRMKSSYYVAIVTRAYRKALDALDDPSIDWRPYREELHHISHREYSTGFFYGHGPVETAIDKSTSEGYLRDYLFCGFIGEQVAPGIHAIDVKNQIRTGRPIEYIGCDILSIRDDAFQLLDDGFRPVEQADHGKVQYLKTDKPIHPGYIIRRENVV